MDCISKQLHRKQKSKLYPTKRLIRHVLVSLFYLNATTQSIKECQHYSFCSSTPYMTSQQVFFFIKNPQIITQELTLLPSMLYHFGYPFIRIRFCGKAIIKIQYSKTRTAICNLIPYLFHDIKKSYKEKQPKQCLDCTLTLC